MKDFESRLKAVKKNDNQLIIVAEYYTTTTDDELELTVRKKSTRDEISRMSEDDFNLIEHKALEKQEQKIGIEFDHLESWSVYFNGIWYSTFEEMKQDCNL